MSPSRESFAVAGGRGLALPTRKVPIRQRSWESSAPAFLRRTAEELAALDAEPGQVIRTSTPEKVKKRKASKPSTGGPRGPVLDEAAVIAAYRLGGGQAVVARQFHTSKDRVRRILTKHKIEPHRVGRPKNLPPQDAVVAEYESGDGLQVIARRHHCHADSVREVLAIAGVKVRTGNVPKVWSEQDTADIVKAYEAGAGTRELSLRYRTGRNQISALLHDQGITLRTYAPGVFDPQIVASQYQAGDSLLTLSKRYKADKARLRDAITEQSVAIRAEGFR